ncbi:flagellin N-terminal helical domain-containing protein [Niveispirillum cyanobacteriorum]|uniref:Flagellin n=1 Tax=Niveispirillum cyanobacteriorum TaxID=1612173 RepID=A0A2K9N8F6_9PROT|nr:flagellin [Niveispirillum cyanobacteriorum]AUN29359.1 flagellin [Niveispirillum cyanobacteriorum]GGE64838.1 flagellin [Niveispirillum cyanobacteriorum]
MSTSDVQLTAGMRNNLLLLQKTNKQVESIQNRLSTGNKINSALDGPTNFFAAKGLSVRATDLSKLKESMGQSISTIQAGDKGITAIESLIEQAKGLTTTAYGNLGTDAASVATRKSLADQFNRLKDQIDKIARDSGYQGKNLLVGNGLTLDSTAGSRANVNSIEGMSNSRVTNVVSADTYSIRVTGTGAISADLEDIAKAETARGIASLKVSGTISATAGNFADVSIEMRGNVGRERTLVITEGAESRTVKFFDNTQAAVASTVTAGTSGTAQVSKVTISGSIEEGDTFTATVNGKAYSYKVTADDLVTSAGVTRNPAELRQQVASKLAGEVAKSTDFGGDGTTAASDPLPTTLGTADNTGARFNIAYGSTNGTPNDYFEIQSDLTTGTGVSFNLGATSTNTLDKAVSISFSSGTVVTFTVDRTALDNLGTSGNGTSTVEKNVDLTVSATNLNGVTIERSAANARGSGKLSDGENSLAFDSGTVRFEVDSATLKQAASAQRSNNLITVQRTDANTENDLTVQFNEANTSTISVVSQNIQTDGQGLRLDYAQNNFLDRADIDKAVSSLDFATAKLRSTSQALSTNLNIIQTRENFTSEFSNVLTEGSNKLVQADQNEEGANLLLLQTRQQLGTISLSLANQAQQAILRLF